MMHDISAAIAASILELYDTDVEVELTRPEPQFGDFATNVAMKLAPRLSRPPREVAEKIAEALHSDVMIQRAEVAGPGFINLTITDEVLADSLAVRPVTSELRGQVIVIETNNPNPFKDLHIGHAYNCIIPDTLANLLEVGGAQVHRVSYHGDVGLHVGRSMWAILRWCGGDIAKLESVPEEQRPQFMSARYIEGSAAYRDDPAAHDEIEQLAKQSFAPEGEFLTVYEICKRWSFDYIDATVARIGSKPVEKRYLESQADAAGVAVVREHIGEVFTESDGAIVFAGEAFGLHTRVFIASRGTSLYEARDLGLMQLKQRDFHPARSIIVTGGEQREYFRVIIKAAELALPELKGVTHNISTGTVKLSTGKMSSRTGEVLNIEWLFDQLSTALVQRGGQADDRDTVIGALRYTMLRSRIGSDVIFDINTALSLEGNSGPYLQYAYARARSIIRKSLQTPTQPSSIVFDERERLLALKLSAYSDVLEAAIRELLPHQICTYLYELAQEFNRFYEHSRIVGDEREPLRLWLADQYAAVLGHGLTTLGIPAPERL